MQKLVSLLVMVSKHLRVFSFLAAVYCQNVSTLYCSLDGYYRPLAHFIVLSLLHIRRDCLRQLENAIE